MDALKRGDEATAREMLDEAARRKGYGDAESDYQGEGAWAAPANPGYKSADERRADLENNTIFNVEDMALGYSAQPEDYFKYPKRYAQDTPHGRESTQSIQKAIEAVKRGEKDVKVKVYRAVPTSVKEGKLRNGDWVTPSRIYAEMHGNNRLEGKYRIIEDEVPVDELWWDGNDANEWGYDNGKGYKYKNVKNNRKSDDLVTRDDKGNVIPPSKRFNQRKADERYQKRTDGVKPSKAEVALRDALVEHMRLSGIDVITDEAEGQRVLDMANGQGIKMSFGEPYDYDNYPRGRVESNLNKISVKIVDTAGNDKGFLNYVEAEKWAKEHLCKVYTDEETGGKGEFSIVPKVINKYVSKAARDKSDNEYLHYVVLQNLPSIIHDSIDTETHPNFTSHGAKKEAGVFTYDKNTLVHVLYGAVKIGDKLCRVKLTAKEYPNNERTKPYSFMVTSIDTEIESLEPIGVQARSEDGYSNNSISAAKLLNGVEMSYDKGKNLLEESKKRSDSLREQRVYHGSGAEFDHFDHVRFFRTANGEAYGFTVGGKIYIDPRIATSETPIHEYAHLWATALKSANAKEWQNVVGLMKGTKVWDEVKALYPELKSDDEIADEVLATYSGRRGAERLREEQRRIAKGNGGVFEKAEAISALERVKQALKRFWKGVADFLHIHYTSAEEVADRVMKDLLDGVDPRKFGDGGKSLDAYNKIRKHFIGEQGAERADHAEEVTTRIDNLNVAREMEDAKKDAKAIKMATGWERGADGKWRYEIPDLKYFGKGDAGYKKARGKQPWSKELDGLSDKIFDGEELSESEYRRFDELVQKEDDFKTDYLNREKPHLADWVENDELFKAYPDLKRVNVVFTDQLPTNVGGSYNEREHTIVVNTNYVGDIDSVLAHEVQHAIQKIEGFARGGNPESIQERFKAAKKEWRARAWADELRYKADEMGEHYNQAAVEKALIDEYKEMGMDNEEWMPDKETRMKGFNYFARGYADRSMDADIKNFRLAESARADFSPYMEYTKLGGEVESRNVEKRMKMSPEERRASLAAETEDVSREDQIFLFGEGGTSMKTSSDLNEMFGSRWLDEQTNDDGRHTTQVKSTINSYKKFVDWVKRDSNGRDVDVLDASSGLGLGTAWMRDNGFKVDDVEPFPSDSREAPTFSSYDEIDKKYDYIISNAVLNVIPDDWRANVLHQMADKLKDGGKLVINVRGAESISKQGKEGETRITLDSPSEILVLRPNGSIKAYQKGFTKSELKEWCEKELGEGYSVEIANNKNAGGSYDTAVVVTKNNESGTVGVASEAGHPSWSAQAMPNSVAKLNRNPKLTKDLDGLLNNISKKGMGAHEFLFNVAKTFGLKGDNFNKSFYTDLGDSVGIRISDHYANTNNVKQKNKNNEVYGFVVKLSPHRFKSREDANYLEYVYYPDKLTQERQQEIVGGLKKFLETGDYAQLPSPDHVNRSGVFATNDNSQTKPSAGPREAERMEIKQSLRDGTFIQSGSYFSGGGLLEEGLKNYLDPKVAVEFNSKISGVYADNHGRHIVTADVRDVDPATLVGQLDSPVEYFHASPVCKNFSRAKREAGEVELDKETARSTADFIKANHPKVVTIENVKGYRDSEALKIITDELSSQGYDWDMDVYNAADFGGYTSRERLIVRAVRDGELPPKPKAIAKEDRKKGWMEAVSDLIPTLHEKRSGVPEWMDSRLKAEGIDWHNIDKPLYVFGQGNNKNSVPHAFADELLPTLRTKGGDVIIMPDGRVLRAEPRVLARVTGLSDDYHMPITDDLAHTIVGNGIPAQLSQGVIGPLLEGVFNGGERVTQDNRLSDDKSMKYSHRIDGGIANKTVSNVIISSEDKVPQTRDEALSLLSTLEQPFKNKDQGVDIYVSKRDARHSMSFRNIDQIKAMSKIDKIAEEAVKIGEVPVEDDEKETTKAISIYYCPVNVAGKQYSARLTVKTYFEGSNVIDEMHLYNYQLRNMAPFAQSVSQQVLPTHPNGTISEYKVGDLIHDTQQNDLKMVGLENDSEKQSRRGTPNLNPDHIAQAIYEQSVSGFKFDLDEAWHDSLLSVKRLQEAISETRGVPIRDFENAYWHAVALSSVNAAEMEQLMNLRIQPFIEAVQDICKKHDLTQEDIEVYLNCKHGLERNEAMARRDAEKQANEEFKDELRKAERAAAKDPLDQDAADALDDVKQRMNDREEELYLENREKDYSGLTDIFDPKDKVTGDRLDLTVAELEDEAKKYVKRFEAEVGVADVTKLWDNIHELNNYSLRKSYLCGLISKSQYDSVKQMYQWYVPLRGFNEEVAGDVYTYVRRGETRTQQHHKRKHPPLAKTRVNPLPNRRRIMP